MFDEFNIPKQHAPEHAHQSSDIQDAKKNNLDMAADAAYCKFLPIYEYIGCKYIFGTQHYLR